jgi:Zn-dependent protease with chaperone function
MPVVPLRLIRACRLLPLCLALLAPATGAHAGLTARPDEQRLNAVGYRLATANGPRCERPEMFTGIQFHELGGYPAAQRDGVAAASGLGWGFGVLDLVPGSTAELAGLRQGDELVSLDGESLETFRRDLVADPGRYDRIAALVARLDQRLAEGPAQITVRRSGQLTDLQLTAKPACGGRTVYFDKRSLNAWSDGRYVAVTARMMELARDDDELAFVVAHEMAHNMLDHARTLADTSPLLAEFGFGSGRVKRAEIAADELAVALMASAGMDLGAPQRLLQRARKLRPFDLSLSHPGIGRRIRITQTVATRIAAMQEDPVLATARIQPSTAFSTASPDPVAPVSTGAFTQISAISTRP